MLAKSEKGEEETRARAIALVDASERFLRARLERKKDTTTTMWSATLAWENLWGSSEEFLQQLGPRYVFNIFRVLVSVSSGQRLRGKFPHPLSRFVSAWQILAVALTFVPHEYGLYAYSSGIMAFTFGVMVFCHPGGAGVNALYCAFSNYFAFLAWRGLGGLDQMWPMNSMGQYEFQMKCMNAGFVVGVVEGYQRCKRWYVELTAAQDALEVENMKKMKKAKSKKDK